MNGALRFTLYTRPGCHLCEEMHQELTALPAARVAVLELVDVDQDRAARERYGHKIPVLLLNGELVCHGSLNTDEVHKALAYHA